MNVDQLNVFVAWWGAITGTAVLFFEIFKYIRGGSRLSVSIHLGQRLFGNFNRELGSGYEDWSLIKVSAVNRGNSPTTVKLVAVHLYKSRFHKLIDRPVVRAFCQTLPLGQTLPAVISPGEEWVGFVRQDRLMEMEEFKISKAVYFTVEDNQTDKPRFIKLHLKSEKESAV